MIAFLIILPFAIAFVFAGIHEYLRYKSEGRATYGLVYDEESGTTHVTGIAEGEEAYGGAGSCARVSGASNSMAMRDLIGMESSLDAKRLFSLDG